MNKTYRAAFSGLVYGNVDKIKQMQTPARFAEMPDRLARACLIFRKHAHIPV